MMDEIGLEAMVQDKRVRSLPVIDPGMVAGVRGCTQLAYAQTGGFYCGKDLRRKTEDPFHAASRSSVYALSVCMKGNEACMSPAGGHAYPNEELIRSGETF